MLKFFGPERNRIIMHRLPFILNGLLIALGIFIILSMSVVIAIFEEFTAFTDFTQQWIEFNFFLYYWDKLTIARVYLSFLYIYGGAMIAIASYQIHGIRKRNVKILFLAPKILLFVAIVSILGALSWLIVTAVNHNEGFLATGGFIFERMRFKGNVWKDLKFREQSWRIVAANQVPRKAFILRTWVFQRQRDFDCCGWDSYLDYQIGNYTTLPESCCKRKYRIFGCGDNYLIEDKSDTINTRGCGPLMYDWYRSGFGMNIAMAIVGIVISAFQFYTYTVNRRQFFKFLYDTDDMKRPMMNSLSLSTINSKGSAAAAAAGLPFIPSQHQLPSSRTSSTRNVIPQIINSQSGYAKAPIYEKPSLNPPSNRR